MDDERPEGSDVVVSKGECPECGSSQGFVTYADGHAHCYGAGCTHFVAASEDGTQKPSTPKARFTGAPSELLDPRSRSSPFDAIAKRGIESKTLKQYGVFHHGYNGKPVLVAPYFDMDGNPDGQKLRFPTKDFTYLKAYDTSVGISKCQLFGRHVYGDKFDRQVIICEGELDALSVAQVLDFKVAVVSVNSGAQSAMKNLKANYLWLDRFTEIVLWFDNDEAGELALAECGPLFQIGKVRIAKAFGTKDDGTPCKDASDILQAGRAGDIRTAIYKAVTWRPAGIINASLAVSHVLAPKEKAPHYNYPPCMPLLQEMTGGMFPGDVTYHVAGTGIGKSSVLREIEYDLAVMQHIKVAVLSFEDMLKDAMMGIMSIHVDERLQLNPVPDPEDKVSQRIYDLKMSKIHAEVFGSGNVELFDPETAEWSMDAILSYIRYCAKGLDCKVVVVDPISFVAAGIELTADERRVLDKVAGEFAKLAKELGIALHICHHLKRTQGVPHEEGAPTSLNELRSSGGLANFATCVVGWERNNQAEGDAWRVTQARIIKPVRRTGRSGLADLLYYGENGRLIKSPIPFPPIGKPDGKEETGSRGGFAAVGPNDY